MKNEVGEAVTTITEPGTLRGVFWALIALSIFLYVVGLRHRWGQWDRWEVVRAAIPALAFVAWTMLQKSTAFDAVAPGFEDAPRFAVAAIGAAVLGVVAALLARKADEKPPTQEPAKLRTPSQAPAKPGG